MDEYDIYIRAIAADRDETPEQRLARVFGLDARRAHEFVQSLPRCAKRNVPAKHAPRYALALRELGADFELRKSAIQPQVIIAVQNDAEHEARAQQHGGTLTLPPPTFGPVSARPAGATESQFAQTVADRDDRLALDASLFSPGASPFQTLRESSPAVDTGNRTIREAVAPEAAYGATPAPLGPPERTLPWGKAPAAQPARVPASMSDPRPPPASVAPASYTWPEQRAPNAWPPPQQPAASVPSPPPAARTPASLHPAAEAPASPSAWSGLEPHPAVRSAPPSPWAPVEPNAPGAAAPSSWSPPPAQASPAALAPPAYATDPALGFDGRPEWLVAGSHLYEQTGAALYAPAGSAPNLGMPQYGEPEKQADEQGPDAERAPARGARARGAMPARPGVRSDAVRAIGVPIGRELPASELPMPLRIGLRIGIGVSLFVILATLRQCRAFDSDVERALAQWDHRASSEMAETGSNSREGGRPSNYGPVAGEWLESDLHQCSSGDKDRARSLVDRYKAAGAVEVYIGGIVRSGPIQIAGELIVELPSDPGQRKSVLAEHRRVLDAAFGGFANDSDPGGPVLRVTI